MIIEIRNEETAKLFLKNMPKPREYITLEKLEAYQLARELSRIAWEIYIELPYEVKWKTGLQFVDSTDSVGANIAEGYGRFHYLDKV